MSTFRWLRQSLAWLAVCGTGLPISCGAAPLSAATSRAGQMHDVALSQGGLLVGQLLDDKMTPMAGTEVTIQCDGHTMARTKTDQSGVFAVAGLRGGVHQVVASESIENCRLWAPGTAPPSASENLRLVPGQHTVVRGQWGAPANPFLHQAKTLATNPWVVGGVVAAAVAVPVIIHNTKDDDNGS